jgi:hypothetical protein
MHPYSFLVWSINFRLVGQSFYCNCFVPIFAWDDTVRSYSCQEGRDLKKPYNMVQGEEQLGGDEA